MARIFTEYFHATVRLTFDIDVIASLFCPIRYLCTFSVILNVKCWVMDEKCVFLGLSDRLPLKFNKFSFESKRTFVPNLITLPQDVLEISHSQEWKHKTATCFRDSNGEARCPLLKQLTDAAENFLHYLKSTHFFHQITHKSFSHLEIRPPFYNSGILVIACCYQSVIARPPDIF